MLPITDVVVKCKCESSSFCCMNSNVVTWYQYRRDVMITQVEHLQAWINVRECVSSDANRWYLGPSEVQLPRLTDLAIRVQTVVGCSGWETITR